MLYRAKIGFVQFHDLLYHLHLFLILVQFLIEVDLIADIFWFHKYLNVAFYYEVQWGAQMQVLTVFVYIVDTNVLVIVFRFKDHKRKDPSGVWLVRLTGWSWFASMVISLFFITIMINKFI